MADVGEEGGLGTVQLGQFLGAPLLGLVAAGAADAGGDVPGGQLDEPPVALVEVAVAVQPGDEEAVRGAALLEERDHERLDGRLGPAAAGQPVEGGAGQRDEPRLPVGERGDGPHAFAAGYRKYGGCEGGSGGDAGRAGEAGVVAVEEVGEGEGQVPRVAGELPVGEGQHLLLGADHAGVGAEVAQGGHAPPADHPLGVLADDAQHADDVAVVVAQRAVGEGVVGLLGVTGPLQEEEQPLVPGGAARGEHGVDTGADVAPDLRPHLAGGPSQRPRVLTAEGVAPVGVVAEEGQLLAPRHPHGEPGGEQDADGRLQTLRPLARRAERCGRPVDAGEVRADLRVGGEHLRVDAVSRQP
ncbi:hypothetical protein ACFU0X_06060 [Streptomyces cellulosae]|uniref:Uncharacterized protein n=1 Tax=Streptomyces cellulosae TaxID=1968 RepID=A0ABW6JBX1_STRCE